MVAGAEVELKKVCIFKLSKPASNDITPPKPLHTVPLTRNQSSNAGDCGRDLIHSR